MPSITLQENMASSCSYSKWLRRRRATASSSSSSSSCSTTSSMMESWNDTMLTGLQQRVSSDNVTTLSRILQSSNDAGVKIAVSELIEFGEVLDTTLLDEDTKRVLLTIANELQPQRIVQHIGCVEYTAPNTLCKANLFTKGNHQSTPHNISHTFESKCAQNDVKNDTDIYDTLWLRNVCKRVAKHCDAADVIMNAMTELLCSNRSCEDIQTEMLDLIGAHHIEDIVAIFEHRQELKLSLIQSTQQNEFVAQTQSDENALFQASSSGHSTAANRRARKSELRRLHRQTRRDKFTAMKVSNISSHYEDMERKENNEYERNHSEYIQYDTLGNKATLPSGTTRVMRDRYEQVIVPAKIPPERASYVDSLVCISSLEVWAQTVFTGLTHLNRMQSKCFKPAYTTNANLLICAPTGAGKTNVALLTILQEIRQHYINGVLDRSNFKVVYVCPMKALAQEVVVKFGQRLRSLGISVRELTGDMQLSRREIEQTQIIVTTPEKWDVITRKSGDGSLAALVRLLILDEVHILHDDRGSVIEILVARTIRQVESSQQMIRIVGLSATLPNYEDVATFLRVNPDQGLLAFDASYRPVPLEQTFIGVTEKNNSLRLKRIDEVCHEKMIASVRQGHQVMIFVHARKGTAKTGQTMIELARENGTLSLLEKQLSESRTKQYTQSGASAAFAKSKNRELRELAEYGIGIHHAGMIRADRNLVEKHFTSGYLRVIISTATLAWGVNLPAHTVIIKGTSLYNPEKGGFVDLGMLDVMQIFGRAGRPQFDTSGEGIIITTHDKLAHYLRLLTLQMPIESQFIHSLPDHLNAEINLGTVTCMREAMMWLSYTYLVVRMSKNPMHYGITYEEAYHDTTLASRRRDLLDDAVRKLKRCRMLRTRNDQFMPTDLGRTASHFYLNHESVEQYNATMSEDMSEDSILHVISASKEFEQIKVRNEELKDLDYLLKRVAPVPVNDAVENTAGKVNVLLQTYISRVRLTCSSLISDTHYITQSASRICRALFQIVTSRGWLLVASCLLLLAKSIDRKQWDFESPLRQLPQLITLETCKKIEDNEITLSQLLDLSSREIGEMLHHFRLGESIKKAALCIPRLQIEFVVKPITNNVLKVQLQLTPMFNWVNAHHGNVQPFHIWVFDGDEVDRVHHHELLLVHKHEYNRGVIETEFFVPIEREPKMPSQYYVELNSDLWMGSNTIEAMSFQHLLLPEENSVSQRLYTPLLDLQPLPIQALHNEKFEALYRSKFQHFNPVQTQAFHVLYNSDDNVLFGAPTGSGKTIVSELCILRLLNARLYSPITNRGSKTIYIAPLKALARERLINWRMTLGVSSPHKLNVIELSGDVSPSSRELHCADIVVATPEKIDGVSRQWRTNQFIQHVQLVIFDEVHLLGQDRGHVLENIVSRLRFISSLSNKRKIRLVALSTALANPENLADWLGVHKTGLFNFHPSVRPVPLSVHISCFPGQHYCPRMALMNKPTYSAIMTHSHDKPTLVFVSSRRQTRLTAIGLISLVAADGNPHTFLNIEDAVLQAMLAHVNDQHLRHALAFGIGMHHAGLIDDDRRLVEQLFLQRRIQVLVCTATLSWGVNLPAHLVVVKGTEYYDARYGKFVDMPITDILQMIGRAGRPQYDDNAVACVLVHEPKKAFYQKFLYSPFPVESSALSHLHDAFNAEICSGQIKSTEDAVDYLSWTFLFRRLPMNPSFYGLKDTSQSGIDKFLLERIHNTFTDLCKAKLISYSSSLMTVNAYPLGILCSKYYLHYKSAEIIQLEINTHNAIVELPHLLRVLCSVSEFSELPVRHNEDGLNETMSQSCLWPVSNFDSPHTKANLLLQARMQHVTLPHTDYITDTKTVLDQCMRVLNAMLEWSAQQALANTALKLLCLMQHIVQARMPTESSLLSVCNHLQHHTLEHLSQRGIHSVSELSKAVHRVAQSKDKTRGKHNTSRTHKLVSLLGKNTSLSNDNIAAFLDNLDAIACPYIMKIQRIVDVDDPHMITLTITLNITASSTEFICAPSACMHRRIAGAWMLVVCGETLLDCNRIRMTPPRSNSVFTHIFTHQSSFGEYH